MIYSEFEVHRDLDPYVQLVWMMESEYRDDQPRSSLIMPDGIVEVVFHYGDPWITTVAGGNRATQPDCFAISQMRLYIEIESAGSTGFVSVRFYPWGAYHFFDKPVNEFVDSTIEATALWPVHCGRIMETIRSASSPEERVNCVQRFLTARLREYRKDDSGLDEAIKLIRSTGGQMAMEEVRRCVGLSKKQLERKFLPAVGTTPKTFARISRFLSICHHLDRYKATSLTELGYECGYYDQAHFIKEFKAFSGFTPKAFFKKHNVSITDI